jgi:lantibiotic modifying enzyme
VSETRADSEAIAEQALEWIVSASEPTEHGLRWRSRGEVNHTLYGGGAGILMALLEAHHHFALDRYLDVARAAGRELAEAIDSWDQSSLYFGLTGAAVALRALADVTGDPLAHASAARALEKVRTRFDGERWGEQFEMLAGNAGIALGALYVGDLDLAVLAVHPYLAAAEETPAGLQWEHRRGVTSRLHHISHGTLGIVHALAAVGLAAQRPDLVELALGGAADVVSRSEATSEGFLVPHSDPPYRPELIERISYGWCHGPAGDAQVFRLLSVVTGDPRWTDLTDRCWQTLITSGLPQRLRPGFWDNSARCCGTAGVLAFASDRRVERGGDLHFARRLVNDIAARATIDAAGARWSNVEHRATPGDLEPEVGWAQGNAGIIRELLRVTRLERDDEPDYFVPWPDHPAAGPRTLAVRSAPVT